MSRKICYKTVSKEAEAFLVEKKSKFISSVRPVCQECEAIEFIGQVRKKYPDANHHVYAYVIDENQIFRYSDDGEPQGTAGMPVLDTIRKEGLVDVAVVVTRYFGGTLLGTGGLVHAYGAGARQGLLEAGIVTRSLCNIVAVNVDYTLVGKVQHKIAVENYILEDTLYENEVTFLICCLMERTEHLLKEMTELTNGRAICKVMEQKYVDL